jgi:hypothetical protein
VQNENLNDYEKKKIEEWDKKIIHITFTIMLSALTAIVVVTLGATGR